MTSIRSESCSACPYRRDVASGVWAEHEYDKLPPYDAPTGEQPFAPFMCHATPDHYCRGWAAVHANRGNEHDLLALRLARCGDRPEPEPERYFASGAEAAEHGKRDVAEPTLDAQVVTDRLLRKHPRLKALDEWEGEPNDEPAAVAPPLTAEQVDTLRRLGAMLDEKYLREKAEPDV